MRVCDRRRVLCADVCMNVCTSVCVGSVHRCVRVSAPASPAEGLPPRLWGRARLRPSPPQISSLGSCSSSRWGRGEGLAGAEGPGGFFSKWPFSWLRRTRPYAEDRRSGARGVASIPSSSTAGEQSSDGARQRLQDLPAAGLQVPPAPPRPGGRRGLALGKQRPSPPPHPPLGGHWAGVGGRRLSRQLPVSPATLPECSLSTGGSAAPLPRPGARSGLERVLFCVSASPEGGARGAALPDEAGVS